MLSSKANAALARLKEIEEKYKMKRREQKWKEDTDSSISSVSIIASEDTSAKSKESPKKATKPKLDIKMPDTRLEGCAEETKLSSKSEKSTPDEVTAKLPEDAAEVDLYVTTPLDDKSSRSTGKQESLISDIKTIQENSSIESVPDDSVTPSKSLSRSKTPRRNSSTTGDRPSGREERTRAAARSEAGKESGKSSEILRGKAPSDNSSIAKRSRLSGKPNERVSKVSRPGPRKRSIEDKAIAGMPNEATSVIRNGSSGSETLRDNSIVEESIGTVEDVSEIISELSRSEESFAVKIGDSVDVPESSKHLTTEIASLVVSNSSKHLIAENGYANDTFEDISSSTVRSKSGSQRGKMIDGRKEAVDGAEFNAKEIDIGEHKSYQASAESHRKKQVIEIDLTPKPNATKVGPRPLTYVSDFESTIANPVNVIKLSKSASSRSKDQRRHYQHRKESFRDENISSAESSRKNISDSSESSIGDVTKMGEKKNSPGMTTVWQESGRKEREEASNRTKERALRDVTGLSVVDDEDRMESVNSNSSSEEQEEERQDVSKESLDQRISQDAEYVLRKLHKDAINALAKRHASSKSATKPLKSSSVSKIESEVLNTSRTREVTAMREENESCRPSENDKVSDHNDRECNTKRKKKGAKITNKKSTETRNSAGSRKEDKALRFDGRQTRRLRRRIVELRLQQEREDLQKYLHELKDLRLESGSTRSYFKPLEFPKIAEFAQPDVNYSESKPDDQRVVLRERVLAIRQWLKDQYVLYRDYCTMAQAINAHYVPTTLEDAKKTIRELKKTTIKTR